jgi:hypothetical protein
MFMSGGVLKGQDNSHHRFCLFLCNESKGDSYFRT